MALIWINEVSVSFGGPRLLDGASLRVEAGERIGLLGRNGSGKSTLMKLLTGDLVPDSGEIVRSGDVKVAMLPQDVPDDLPGAVYDVVAAGGDGHLELLREYHLLTREMARTGDESLLPKLETVQHRLESSGAWHYHQRVETVISRTGLQADAEFRFLSAGMKRRVFLARALVSGPDLLLLDEPTNHLDIGAILWLEEFLRKFEGTLMFVTHDRAFLRRLATRIVEIDRGRLMSFPCDYDTYLERRQAGLAAEERQWQEFDRKLAREEVWVRQGIKARRTRNEGRVRALEQMRRERERRRERVGDVRLAIREAERSGRLVAEAEKIGFSFDDRKIVAGFSTVILRGDKVGIIGPNGSGKTTLLKILLGELAPQQGTVRLGSGVRIAYFDQLRAQLDENRTLKENIADGNDMIVVDGTARHIVGYLQDFLFPPEQILAPVRSLSGGERNRLLLAKLFVLPSNLLVLDEPTNDLDAETLELLEERLMAYGGTVLLVSHDREFLNNVVTSTIVFEGEGRLQEYVGGYDDWLRQRAAPAGPVPAAPKEPDRRKARAPKERQKLTFKEARELESLPQQLEALEGEKERLIETLNSPALYERRDAVEINRASDRLAAVEKELDTAYKRWEELEGLAAKFGGEPA
ncbi:MAG: ATP-binding cassette domain-containing protein [Deltaproteobacteria bacterium]|nr:ATP-binding cassette domain-containing protein [Deltaproteobacteria bacterium]